MNVARPFPHRPYPLLVAIACLLLVAGSAVSTAEEGPGLEEPSTDLVFPLETSPSDLEQPLVLTGVGVRKKLFFKVYALGLYVDPGAVRDGLSRWNGRSSEQLEEDDGVYQALMDLPGHRLVVMRFVRDVGASSMREAMEDALTAGNVALNDPAGSRFLKLWDEPIADGERVALLFGPEGRVAVSRDSRAVGEVRSHEVSRALLATWLGPDPVSDDIREGAVARLPQLLSAAD
jgi:hypothetical protein